MPLNVTTGRHTFSHALLWTIFVFVCQISDSNAGLPVFRDDESLHEYCQLESFGPRCRHGDVIVMTSARFGRMRTGRCIDESALTTDNLQNSLGCSADVLDYAHRTCSGRPSCEVPVFNRDLLGTRPCSSQLTMYLEASFRCVAVVEEDRSCSVSVSTGVRQHIRASSSTGDSSNRRCGSRDHPWMLEAQTGQQINISLLDFTGGGRHVDTEQSTGQNQCRLQYGYIVDKTAAAGTRSNVSICASRNGAETNGHIYTSAANMLEIVLNADSVSNASFLLAIEAVGCSNLVPPADAWLRRSENEATIGCYLSYRRWTLRCVNNQWIGTIGTCPSDFVPAEEEISEAKHNVESDNKWTTVQILIVVAVSSVGLAVCLIIIFVGIGCTRRYTLKSSTYTDSADLLPGYDVQQKTTNGFPVATSVADGNGFALDGPPYNTNINRAAAQPTHFNRSLPQYFVLDRDVGDNVHLA